MTRGLMRLDFSGGHPQERSNKEFKVYVHVGEYLSQVVCLAAKLLHVYEENSSIPYILSYFP